MKTIFKYPLTLNDNPIVQMPRGALPMSVGMQWSALTVWVLVDPSLSNVDHQFAVRGTGHPVTPEVEQGDFIGTVFDGPFVWHVFSLGDIG